MLPGALRNDNAASLLLLERQRQDIVAAGNAAQQQRRAPPVAGTLLAEAGVTATAIPLARTAATAAVAVTQRYRGRTFRSFRINGVFKYDTEPMSQIDDRALLTRYAVAWAYFACFVVAESAFAALSSHDRSAVVAWASTNVVNLRHDPVGTLVVSGFFSTSLIAAWPVAIGFALFGANRVLGNWRTALLCAAGQVLGTLVSEGIVAYRVAHHVLPASDTRIVDVGPSYIVVSALAVAALYGSRVARIAAAADLAALIFGSRILSGLTRLDVAAVGHATALAVSVVLGTVLVRHRRRSVGPATDLAGEGLEYVAEVPRVLGDA